MKNLYFLLVFFVLFACSQRTSKTNSEIKLVKINLDRVFDKKEINNFIEKISSIRFVPLESTDSSLLTISQICINEENIFIVDRNQRKAIFRFTKEGEFINKIDRLGEGAQEYLSLRDVKVYGEDIYVLDSTRDFIQKYDFEGNYIKTIPIKGIPNNQHLSLNSNGEIIIQSQYLDDYYLHVIDQEGHLIGEYFPRKEKFDHMLLKRVIAQNIGNYNNGLYFTQYFDNKIHYLKNNEVTTLFEFDFGKYNIPDNAFEALYDRHEQLLLAEEFKFTAVPGIVLLSVTDDWVIFSPENYVNLYDLAVFYDRKNDEYIVNRDFKSPYSVLLGGRKPPMGYFNGEFYSYLQVYELKELIEELQEKGILSEYKFLQDLKLDQIDEEDNPWLVFYKLD